MVEKFLLLQFTLFVFDLLVFGLMDYWTGSWVAAAAITYGVYLLLTAVRNRGGRSNLARKTLVDERFLI